MSGLKELQWKKFPVLDDGFVCLVDVMGDDASVVQAARVSYGNDQREETSAEETVRGDRHLIRYLMRHRHTTPFEMAEVKLLVRVPMDCWRQWIRHRTANVNEYSTRYTEAIDSQQKTPLDQWRKQSTGNKQGSSGVLGDGWQDADALPDDLAAFSIGYGDDDQALSPGEFLSSEETLLHEAAAKVYRSRLELGVAKEQARKDLPLSTYTEAYWKIDLHNLLHFLGLRMDSHAQKEIRDYATTIGEQIVKPLFPIVWEAFEDYRLHGTFLSRLDKKAVAAMASCVELPCTHQDAERILKANIKGWGGDRSRERDECLSKLVSLELVTE